MAYLTLSNLCLCIAQPCDIDSNLLPFNSPPPRLNEHTTYAPFKDYEAFEFAELMFSKAEISKSNIDALLDIWEQQNLSKDLDKGAPIFSSADEMYQVIDSITHGSTSWRLVSLQ